MCGLVTNGKAISTGEIWSIIIITILGTIVTVNSLAYFIVEYGLFKGNTDFAKGSSPRMILLYL